MIIYSTNKVYAYSRADQLLVFKRVDFPEEGIQIPGGMIEPGETPEIAVICEAGEETGLQGFVLEKYLGSDGYHVSSTLPEEIHLRHFYHMLCAQDTADTWHHYENRPCDVSPDPILFEFILAAVDRCC